tara:strand:- start:4560 stop:5438 length:879 start_codon:yes stop_codon:yes gene_type:complete
MPQSGSIHALLLLLLSLLSPHVSNAQNSQPDPTLRPTLESAFNAWRDAVSTRNVNKWEEITAYSRQIEIRNRIVSQRLPFPDAFFDDPLESPSLNGLIALGILSTGQTATSTYYGKANFGAPPGTVLTDNLLVLHFLREEGVWKFDSLRVVKPGNDGELLLQIRNGDFSFLTGIEFQPAAQLPLVPQPVTTPEYVAEAWINATGYEVSVSVNGHLTGKFANIKTAALIIGGLRRGQNSINLKISKLADSAGRTPKVEVAIYAAKDPEGQAERAFHYRPEAPEADYNSTILID